jgi:CO/xanthine dehydrogenase Mo-binding subunit
VRGPTVSRRGNVERGFKEADVIVEGEFRTQVQTHCCLEPHGIVADWRPDWLTIYSSTQYTTGVRHELAEEFRLLQDRDIARCQEAGARPRYREMPRSGCTFDPSQSGGKASP